MFKERIKLAFKLACLTILLSMATACESWYGLELEASKIRTQYWPAPYSDAMEQLKKGNCDKFLKILWPNVQNADPSALYLLSQSLRKGLILPNRGMYLTGSNTTNSLTLNKDLLFFYIHSGDAPGAYKIISNEHSEERRAFIIKLLERINSASKIENLSPALSCYNSAMSLSECKTIAVGQFIVEDFSKFMKSAANLDSFRSQKAHCVVQHDEIITPY